MTVKNLPILMRDDTHEPLKVGNAQYNDKRGKITFRVELDISEIGAFMMTGKAVELELIESFQIQVIASQMGEIVTQNAQDVRNNNEGA